MAPNNGGITQENNLLMQPYGKKPTRVHKGTIITPALSALALRWFQIQCDNGEKVHVAFALETCDREAMSYIASSKGVDSEMIRT